MLSRTPAHSVSPGSDDKGPVLSRRHILPLLAAPLVAACQQKTGIQLPALLQSLDPAMVDDLSSDVLEEFGGPDPDGRVQNYVASVGDLMLRVSRIPDRPLRVMVLNSPFVNLFPFPNRVLFVTRGLLAALNNEAELAAVLAHGIELINAGTTEAHFLAARPYTVAGVVHRQMPVGSDLHRLTRVFDVPHLAPYDAGRTLAADGTAVRMLANAGYEPAALATALATLRAGAQVEARDHGFEVGADPMHYYTLYRRTDTVMVEAIRKTPPRATTPMLADRESYLRTIDGMSVDFDPQIAVTRDRVTIRAGAGYAVELPPGFRPSPGAEILVGRGPGGAGIAIDTVPVGQLPRLPIYLSEVVARPLTSQGALRQVESFKLSGLDAATGHGRLETEAGPADVRVVVVRMRPDRVARMVFVTPGELTTTLGLDFRRTTQSFRPARREEMADATARRILVVRPGLGDSIETLAARLPYDTLQIERLFALNGIAPGSSLAPSEPVKTIRR